MQEKRLVSKGATRPGASSKANVMQEKNGWSAKEQLAPVQVRKPNVNI